MLEKRKQTCVIDWKSAAEEVFTGFEAEEIVADFNTSIIGDNTQSKELKGVPASPGKARGTARVVLNVSHFNKIKEGDILVTVMTRPEYLPVMKKAAAFVTDEGGITCHAAIVAREMKKPCVIATKIGSKIIKDGDEIEVDADTGIIRILN